MDPKHPAANLYKGGCCTCATAVLPHRGVLAGGPGNWQTWCPTCWSVRDRPGPPALVRVWEMGAAARAGEVVRAASVLPHTRTEGVAEWLTVVSSERHKSLNEDTERWYTTWAWVCREAEPEEGAEERAHWAKEEAARKAKLDAISLWSLFLDSLSLAERDTPPGQVRYPTGDDGVEQYNGPWGRQDAAVLDLAGGWLWYLTYNGRDGDCWASNNCEGHSIATRYRLTPALHAAYARAAEAQRAAKASDQ